MPSQEAEDPSTSFTLAFGGVEFCLVPISTTGASPADAHGHGDVMSVSKIGNGEVLINLNNFVGTLRVKNHKHSIIGAGSEALPVPESHIATTEDKLPQDNNDLSFEASLPKEKPAEVAAVEAAVAVAPAAPNPVEDTPSPQANSCAEEEDDEEMPADTPDQYQKQQKGQQKLNFFGKGGKKKQTKKKMIQKPSAASIKRTISTREQKLERMNSRKKTRRSSSRTKENDSSNNNSVTANNNDFNDLFDEPKNNGADNNMNQNNDNDNDNIFTLGQTMLTSQDDESVRDDGGDLSLDHSNNMDGANNTDDEPKSNNAKEERITLVSSKQISQSSATAAAAPCPRWGQTMTMIDHKRLIVYGGQTFEKDNETPKPLADLFVYDLLEHTWTKPVNCDGIARTWHTANFLPERQLMLCFGGEVLNKTTGKLITTDQVMVLDCEIMLWYPPTVSGQVPSGRSGHSGCVLPQTNELVVFGGVKNGRWMNSVSLLDTNRWRWGVLKAVGDAPPPCSYHSATALGTDTTPRVVIFGGNNGSKCFNGVHVLEGTGDSKKWVWSNPKCKGTAPSPRTGHNATLLNDGSTILVYGGWDPNTEDKNGDDLIFGDSFLLDTKTWTWRKGPKPRYEKSSNNAANGGAERVGHSAVLAPGSKGVQVLAFGGRVQENKFAADFQSLIVPL